MCKGVSAWWWKVAGLGHDHTVVYVDVELQCYAPETYLT